MGKTSGGQPGNQNPRVGSLVRGAIRRVLSENTAKGRESLVEIVRKMVEDAEQGDVNARRELFDRLDGKPVQAIVGDDEHPPVALRGIIDLVRPD